MSIRVARNNSNFYSFSKNKEQSIYYETSDALNQSRWFSNRDEFNVESMNKLSDNFEPIQLCLKD